MRRKTKPTDYLKSMMMTATVTNSTMIGYCYMMNSMMMSTRIHYCLRMSRTIDWTSWMNTKMSYFRWSYNLRTKTNWSTMTKSYY